MAILGPPTRSVVFTIYNADLERLTAFVQIESESESKEKQPAENGGCKVNTHVILLLECFEGSSNDWESNPSFPSNKVITPFPRMCCLYTIVSPTNAVSQTTTIKTLQNALKVAQPSGDAP